MARLRSLGLVVLAIGPWAVAAPAGAQDTSTTEASPLYTVTVAPKATPAPPTTPSSSSGSSAGTASAAPASAPVLPGRLASTGADPLVIIAGGLGLIVLSLFARWGIRAALRTRFEDA